MPEGGFGIGLVGNVQVRRFNADFALVQAVDARFGRHGGEHLAEIGDGRVTESPVQAAGIIEAEAQAPGADGVCELADKVALAVPTGAVGVFNVCWPEAVAVMMLGDEDAVGGAAFDEEIGPFIRIKFLAEGVEFGAEVRIRLVAIKLLVALSGLAAFDAHGIIIPFRIGGHDCAHIIVVAMKLMDGAAARSPGGDGKHAPVDEDAKLGPRKPFRTGAAIWTNHFLSSHLILFG